MGKVIKKVKGIKCPECGEKFKDKSGLANHFQLVHKIKFLLKSIHESKGKS